MVIGEDKRGVGEATDPELRNDEKRIPDQNPPLHEPGPPWLPASRREEEQPRRYVPGDIDVPGDIHWALPDEAEGEPIIEAPVDPEPEIDQVDVSKEQSPGKPTNFRIIDPEGEMGTNPEPDRSPGVPARQ